MPGQALDVFQRAELLRHLKPPARRASICAASHFADQWLPSLTATQSQALGGHECRSDSADDGACLRMQALSVEAPNKAPTVAYFATTGAPDLRINRSYGSIRTAEDVPGYPSAGAGDGAPGAGTTWPDMS
jgi:hypothetical protein